MLENYNIALIAVAYIGCINIIGFLFFAWDKHRAIMGYRRIPERDLLFLAFVGGTVGSIIAQHWLRHKTRKQPFKIYLYGVAVLQVILLVTLSFDQGWYFMIKLLAFIFQSFTI